MSPATTPAPIVRLTRNADRAVPADRQRDQRRRRTRVAMAADAPMHADRLVARRKYRTPPDDARSSITREHERELEPPPRLPRGRDLVAHDHAPARRRRAPRADVALVAEVVDLAGAHGASRSTPVGRRCGGLADHAQERGLDALAPHAELADLQRRRSRAVRNTSSLVALAGRSTVERDRRGHAAGRAGGGQRVGEPRGVGLDLDGQLGVAAARAAQLVDRAGEPHRAAGA